MRQNGVYPLYDKKRIAGKIRGMTRFDIRKLRKLAAKERYSELYFHWHKAERMIASSLPAARRYGLRLKRRVENLYAEWFGPIGGGGHLVEG
jgi:hypothetical protein